MTIYSGFSLKKWVDLSIAMLVITEGNPYPISFACTAPYKNPSGDLFFWRQTTHPAAFMFRLRPGHGFHPIRSQ